MVGRSGEDRFSAVDLLEGYEQGEFVLEGLRAERPQQTSPGAGGFIPSIGCSDQQCKTRNRAVAEFLDFGRKGAAGEGFSSLVEKHTVAAIGKLEHPLVQAGTSFHKVALDLGKSTQAGEVILDTDFGELKRRPASCDDFPGQR